MKKNLIYPYSTIKQALKALKLNGEKCLIVVNNKNKLMGTLSDGDIRTAILKNISINSTINKVYRKDITYFKSKEYDINKIKEIFLKDIIGLIPIVDNQLKVIKILGWKEVFKNKEKKKQKILKIPVIIMAGGQGTRLEPFTKILPKPLIPVNDKTIIEHIINKFLEIGIRKFLLSINYKALTMKAFFKELKKNYIIQFIEEKKPLGTIGSLSLLKNKIKSTFFLTNCDILINVDYHDIYNFHLKNKNDLTIVVSNKKINIPYGDCKLDQKGLLDKIIEKPEYNFLINTGFYVFQPDLIKLIKKNQYLDFDKFIKICKKNNKKIGVFPIYENSWTDIGKWSEYKKTIINLQ